MMSPSLSIHILLKINLRIKILYCLLFLETKGKNSLTAHTKPLLSSIFSQTLLNLYPVANNTEFVCKTDKYLSEPCLFLEDQNFHMVVPEICKFG